MQGEDDLYRRSFEDRRSNRLLVLLYPALYGSQQSKQLLSTVERRYTTTPLIRPSQYYDHFFATRKKANSLSYLKTALIRPPRSSNQRPPLESSVVIFVIKISPLIWPFKLPGEA